MSQYFFDGLEVDERAIIPELLPGTHAVLEAAGVFTADLVADDFAGQGKEARRMDRPERFPPFLPAGGDIV